MKRFFISIFILILALTMFSCKENNSEPQFGDGKIPVMVSIAPQKYFLEKIGGDKVNITVLIPKTSSPHSYEPKPEDLKKASKVKAYFTVGIEFEHAWMEKLKGVNNTMKVIHTEEGIEFSSSDEERDEHGHSIDSHIWVSPKLVKIQSENIYRGLAEVDPENEGYYKKNLESFLEEIDSLDKYIRNTLADAKNRKFMVFHPSWGYFAKDYDLEMIPIEKEGKEPSASELAALIDTAKKNNIKVIFVSPSFSTKTAEVIASQIGGKILFIDHLNENWEKTMKEAADIFKEVMEKNQQ